MDIKQALARAEKKLKKSRIESPHLESELILSKILKKTREFILTHPEHKLKIAQIIVFKRHVSKRSKGFPLAYILKNKEFYGYNFFVNKSVLIPRPETELMVDQARQILNKDSRKISIIDIGTGSGCVIISLFKSLSDKKNKINNCKFYALDISGKALAVSLKNAKSHKADKYINFSQSDLLMNILKNHKSIPCHSKFLILANLPYLTPGQIADSPSIKHEPRLALAAGNKGLKYYEKLFTQFDRLLQIKNFKPEADSSKKNKKIKITALLEIDPGQTGEITGIIKNRLPNFKFKIKKDLRGLDRLVVMDNY